MFCFLICGIEFLNNPKIRNIGTFTQPLYIINKPRIQLFEALKKTNKIKINERTQFSNISSKKQKKKEIFQIWNQELWKVHFESFL